MAVAAGVHLNMLPEFWISYSMSRLFGEAGRSFAFDQRGTGYGRGEGCGLVLLKTLEQAVKDNDPIRAVIVGTGINQDGKTPGITMPNGDAQGESIVLALTDQLLTKSCRGSHPLGIQERRHGPSRYRLR